MKKLSENLNQNTYSLIITFLLSLFISNFAWGQTCMLQSLTTRTAFVELFTSEGCSSCPPADKWLTQMVDKYKPSSALFASFHVTYWDYIGWRDRFADKTFDTRQSTYVIFNGSNTSYTPQFFVDSKTFERWSDLQKLNDNIKKINQEKSPIIINVVASNEQLNINIEELEGNLSYLVQVMEIIESAQSNVERGENQGVLLKHTNIVHKFYPLGTNFKNKKTFVFELEKLANNQTNPQRKFFVIAQSFKEKTEGKVLQAMEIKLPCAKN